MVCGSPLRFLIWNLNCIFKQFTVTSFVCVCVCVCVCGVCVCVVWCLWCVWCVVCVCVALQPNASHASSFLRSLDHTQWRTTASMTPQPEAETSTCPTQHSQQTNSHAPGGIRTHCPSKRSPADPRRTPRGHWYLLISYFLLTKRNLLDFRLWPRGRWGLCSSGLLRSVQW